MTSSSRPGDADDSGEPGEVMLDPPSSEFVGGGVAVLMNYDSDTASSSRLDAHSNGAAEEEEDDGDLVMVRPEAPILDVTQFGLPQEDNNSGKGWPFGKRPKRNYSPDERKRRLRCSVEEVLTNKTSLRVAADKWDVAKSSLCDYIRKNNIYVPNLRKNQHPTPNDGSGPPSKRSARVSKKSEVTVPPPRPPVVSAELGARLSGAGAKVNGGGITVALPVKNVTNSDNLRVIAPKKLNLESPWNSGGLPTQVPFSSVPLYGAIAFPGATGQVPPTPCATPQSTVATDDSKSEADESEAGAELSGIRIPLLLPESSDRGSTAAAKGVNNSAITVTPNSTTTVTSGLKLATGFRIVCTPTSSPSCNPVTKTRPTPAYSEDSLDSAPELLFNMSTASSRTMLLSKGLVDFVNSSPSPYHAVATARARLEAAGFVHLPESQPIDYTRHNKFLITRNSSTLIAVAVGGQYQDGNGFSIVGAHTDSPCLKVKPVSNKTKEGYMQIAVETYGGGIWYTWFDRDLTVAGRVLVRGQDGRINQKLVHIKRPIMRLPSLAIHLNRGVNDGFAPNKESHLAPVLCTAVQEDLCGGSPLTAVSSTSQVGRHPDSLLKALSEQLNCRPEEIVDFDLCVADTQPATVGGVHDEFIFAPRLDNLFNSYAGVEGLIQGLPSLDSEPLIRVVALYDNEEVGSQSAQGAKSNLTEMLLRRLAPTNYEMSMARSYLLSADQAHAVHPNYPEVHEGLHRPALHKGIVVKTNANQSYATTAITRAMLMEVASRAGVPLQDFVARQDMGCGSTIGPIQAAALGIPTLDVGGPMLSMHSCREMCCTSSVSQAIDLFDSFYQNFPAIRDSIVQ